MAAKEEMSTVREEDVDGIVKSVIVGGVDSGGVGFEPLVVEAVIDIVVVAH